MQLNFKKVGEGSPLIIMHGLFGSLDNWMSIAKVLAEAFEVFVLDVRNHGQSPHSDDFNYDVMVDDLFEFLLEHNIVDPIVIGHSMGGKIAMKFTLKFPLSISKLVVVDIAPKYYPVHHHLIIEGLSALDFNCLKSRNEAEQVLSKFISDKSVLQFLLKNLHWRGNNKLDWRFNLPVIRKNIEKIGEGLDKGISFSKPTLFLSGENSNYILEDDDVEIFSIFPKAQIKTISNCGHWVHAENPSEFIITLMKFL